MTFDEQVHERYLEEQWYAELPEEEQVRFITDYKKTLVGSFEELKFLLLEVVKELVNIIAQGVRKWKRKN